MFNTYLHKNEFTRECAGLDSILSFDIPYYGRLVHEDYKTSMTTTSNIVGRVGGIDICSGRYRQPPCIRCKIVRRNLLLSITILIFEWFN